MLGDPRRSRRMGPGLSLDRVGYDSQGQPERRRLISFGEPDNPWSVRQL